jgi:hypothetical protein
MSIALYRRRGETTELEDAHIIKVGAIQSEAGRLGSGKIAVVREIVFGWSGDRWQGAGWKGAGASQLKPWNGGFIFVSYDDPDGKSRPDACPPAGGPALRKPPS